MNAATRVFGIPELLDIILSNLTTVQVCGVRRVSSCFNSAIKRLPPLRILTPRLCRQPNGRRETVEYFLRDIKVGKAIYPIRFAQLVRIITGTPRVPFLYFDSVSELPEYRRLRIVAESADSRLRSLSWRSIVLSADAPFELRIKETGRSRQLREGPLRYDHGWVVFSWEDPSDPFTLGDVVEKLREMALWAAEKSNW